MKYRGLWLPLIILMFIVCIYDSAIATDFGPFQGKTVDADTKEPIEGVVVLVEWHKKQLLADASIYLDAQETVSDKDGKFYLPGIWIFNPFHRYTVFTTIIIFKSGYEAERWAFSKWKEINPKVEGVLKVEDKRPVIMLKKLTMEERRKQGSPPDPPSEASIEKVRLMLKEIDKDRIDRGLDARGIWRGEKYE